MTENTYGEFIEPGTLYFRRLLPGPIERVWSYLTESQKRGEWLASGEWELEVGGQVELIFDNRSLSPVEEEVPEKYKEFGDTSTMYGKITRIEPPRLLSHTWAEEEHPEMGGDSEVTFELTEKGDMVLLELTHRRLSENRDVKMGVSAGWHTHLDIMADRLNGRTPKGFWAVHMALEEEYTERLGL